MENITYADLVTKIGINDLTPGEQYRITDYQTTYYIYEYGNVYPFALTNTTSTDSGTIEPIIVTALTDTVLSLEAKSEANPGDTLYYTIDNIDGGVFASVTGTITRRIDGINKIDIPYDFRTIKVKFDSTDYLSIPVSSINVRIGITADATLFWNSTPVVYTKTIPILVKYVFQNINIDIVDDTNGLLADVMRSVTINNCIDFLGSSATASFCNLQIVDLIEKTGSGVLSIANFIGGYLSNLPNRSQEVYPLDNPRLLYTDSKIGIPGGYFMEISATANQNYCTHINSEFIVP